MRPVQKFSIRQRFSSFKYAFKGIFYFISTQHNLLIHLVTAVIVTVAGIFFRISPQEWIAVVLGICFVIAAEMFNTAIELLTDLVMPEKNRTAGIIKDVAAGAVLVAALAAFVTGAIIFLPKIIACF